MKHNIRRKPLRLLRQASQLQVDSQCLNAFLAQWQWLDRFSSVKVLESMRFLQGEGLHFREIWLIGQLNILHES